MRLAGALQYTWMQLLVVLGKVQKGWPWFATLLVRLLVHLLLLVVLLVVQLRRAHPVAG